MKRRMFWSGLVLTLCLAVGAAFTQSLSSVRLTDTIVKGVGDMNLLKNLSPAALEGLRAANSGRLVLGVDINEAANGTEKAASQGVAVADAWLEVSFADGSQRTYGHAGAFWTETTALLTPAGGTNRAAYYTLLGESGSSRITSNNDVQNIFDATLKIAVPDNLSQVVAAVVRVRLLDTRVQLGDPEAFYDFTAGFEDVAVLTPQDATYIDVVLPTETVFRSEAPAMTLSPEGTQTLADAQQAAPPPPLTWLQQPAGGQHEWVAYEDLIPARGDFDFNDLVVAYRYQLGLNSNGLVERIEGEAYLIARGSTYSHDWTLDLTWPGANASSATCSSVKATGEALDCAIELSAGQLRWTAWRDTVNAFPAPGSVAGIPVNTTAGLPFAKGPKAHFAITLATPVAPPAPGTADPWLRVRHNARTVHLQDRSADGYPFAMRMPSNWQVPTERTDMGLAYPRLVQFVDSSGATAQDWANTATAGLVLNWRQANWAW